MQLQTFQTLWGDTRPWSTIIPEAHTNGFDGIEGRLPPTDALARDTAQLLQDTNTPYIAIIMTGGGVIPNQSASLTDHLTDLRTSLDRATLLQPLFINLLCGNDRWSIDQQVEFIHRAQMLAAERNLTCSFETHRSRILSSPWITLDVLKHVPTALFTADISHWIVTCERLLNDPADDFSSFIAQTHHIQARIGYDQGPQIPHPHAPEYAPWVKFHQSFWEQVWASQQQRGYATTTLTPECGPDGYTQTLPFLQTPLAPHQRLNHLIQNMERTHFSQFLTNAGQPTP